MLGLAENFSAKLTKNGINLKYRNLKHYSFEQIESASLQILRTRKYTTMPTVADFIDAIEGSTEENAEIQKSLFLSAIKNIGTNPNPKFEDKITHDIVYNRIGWSKIRQSNIKDIPFIVKDFKEFYKSYSRFVTGRRLNPPPELKSLVNNLTKLI